MLLAEVLSLREIQIMELKAKGYQDEGIASELFMSKKTVWVHMTRIRKKTGAKTSAELVAMAFKQKLLHMNRKTITEAGTLLVGDRFYKNGSKRIVYEVMGKYGNYIKAADAALNDRAKADLRFQKSFTAATQVVFLRHTRPLPGLEIMIEHLKHGDVFTTTENIAREYRVREQFNDQGGKETKAVIIGTNNFVFIPHGKEVIYIRHEEGKA